MSVQFNLLPDVKLEFARQQKAKRLVYSLSFLVSAVVIAIFVVSFISVDVLQKKLLSDANKDITDYSQKLKSIPQLDKVLTIQNQLHSLPGLHQQKHYDSRLFTYLPQITPTNISIGKVDIDNSANTVQFTGTSNTVENINKFVDTIKFTQYKVNDIKDKNGCAATSGKWDNNTQICTKNAFSSVVLTKVDRDNQGASYIIDSNFDPALFLGTEDVLLIVPQQTTTRSVINTPIFNGQTQTPSKQGAQ
jgi:Tfp pilus assembly protein PilN